MKTRLDLLSQDLVKVLLNADEKTLWKIVVSVSNMALEHTDIQNPLIEKFKSSLEVPVPHKQFKLRRELLSFVEHLDEIQWNLKDQVESGNEEVANYLKAFREARVFNALYYALDQDPYIAAAESIYEIHAAINDLNSLETIIAGIINEDQ